MRLPIKTPNKKIAKKYYGCDLLLPNGDMVIFNADINKPPTIIKKKKVKNDQFYIRSNMWCNNYGSNDNERLVYLKGKIKIDIINLATSLWVAH